MAAKKTAAGEAVAKQAAAPRRSSSATTARNPGTTTAKKTATAKKAAPAKKTTATAKKTTPATKTAPAAARSKSTTAAPASTRTPSRTAKASTAPAAPARTTAARAAAKKASVTQASPTKRTSAKTAAGPKAPVGRLTERLRVKDDESPWSADEITEVRGILVEEIENHREEVRLAEEELDLLLRDSGDGAGDDQADAGSMTAERVHEIALANNARASLDQAEHALEQLDAGTYGICENCGNPIGKLRLQARPRATLCMPCQAKQDRH